MTAWEKMGQIRFGARALCLWAEAAGGEEDRSSPLFLIICSPPVLHPSLCASTSPVSVQEKVCMKPQLALKAAAKGEKFSISSISSKRDFFPSHLVTAVFRKITELMVLLPGICLGVILLRGGGKASVAGCTQHGGELGKVSCASLRRGPAGPSTSRAPSSALLVHENDTEIASPAALMSCSGGERSVAPRGWALACPRVAEGMPGSSLPLGTGWLFPCPIPTFLWV